MSTTNEQAVPDAAIGRLFEDLRIAALADNAREAVRNSADGVLDKYVTIEDGGKTIIAVLADQKTVDSTFTSAEAGASYTTTYSGPAFRHRDMYQATFTAFHHIAPDALGRKRTLAVGVREADVRDAGRTAPETEDVLEDLAFAGINGRMELLPCVRENGVVTRMGVPEAEADSFALFAGRNDASPVQIDIFPDRETANAFLHSLDAQSRDGDGGGYVIPRLEREINNGLPKRNRSYFSTRLDRLQRTDSPDELRRIFEEAEKGAREITPIWERVFIFQPGLHSEAERAKVRTILGDYHEIAAQANRRMVQMEFDGIKEVRRSRENAAERELSRQRTHTEHFERALAYFDDERLRQPNQFTEIGDFYQFQADGLTLFAPYATREIVEDNSPARPAPGDGYTITRNNLAFDRERNKYSVTTTAHYTTARSHYGELYPYFLRAETDGIVPLNEKALTREQVEDLRREALSEQENTMSAQAETIAAR